MMRFLVLSQYFPPEVGAPQLRLAAMARALRDLGHEVEVVTSFPNYPIGAIFPGYRGRLWMRENWDGATIHRTWVYAALGTGARRMLNYGSFAISSLWGMVRSRRPDFVFVESPPLLLSIPGFLAARVWRVPMLFNVADLWPDSATAMGVLQDGLLLRFARSLEQWSYRRADFVIAVSQGIRQTLLNDKGVPAHKVLYLPNGVDIELFRPRPPDRSLAEALQLDGKTIILCAGTLGLAYGLDVALEAMELVGARRNDAVLVLIGDGTDRQRLMKLRNARRLSNVIFLPPATPEYVSRLYSLAYAGMATLKNLDLSKSARPSRVMATMASGKPVVFSGAGEGAQEVQAARAGLVAPPNDPWALAEAICTLLDNPALAEELGRNGRRYVEEYLSWPTLVADWLEQLGQSVYG